MALWSRGTGRVFFSSSRPLVNRREYKMETLDLPELSNIRINELSHEVHLRNPTPPKDVQSAMRLSIAKWIVISQWVLGHEKVYLDDGAGSTCGLCKYSIASYPDNPCSVCPICVYTGADQCHGTPYWGWRIGGLRGIPALDELEFLCDLDHDVVHGLTQKEYLDIRNFFAQRLTK
jgi:hypothetical protein